MLYVLNILHTKLNIGLYKGPKIPGSNSEMKLSLYADVSTLLFISTYSPIRKYSAG